MRHPHLTLASAELASAQVLGSMPGFLCSPSAPGLSGGYPLLSCQLWGRERGQLVVSIICRTLVAVPAAQATLSLSPLDGQKLAESVWDHQLCSRSSKEGESSGGPLTSPGTAKKNPVRGHGVEVAQPFFPRHQCAEHQGEGI